MPTATYVSDALTIILVSCMFVHDTHPWPGPYPAIDYHYAVCHCLTTIVYWQIFTQNKCGDHEVA